ncbi:MAG: DNA methyltransferase [Faecalimonas sp.]|nr:DNA methyltransferase [Faecalimonas sp.]
MAAIHDLLAQVQDEALRNRIEQEINKLAKTKKFGLVFEEHLPECTPLYDVPVKKGSSVAKKTGEVDDVYEVVQIKDGVATCINKVHKGVEQLSLDELVTVAQFGDAIYPYLRPIDNVNNAPDSDLWHTLIEADNYHALQLLEYLYAGKVDCIYIDPPYNSGAKDWKYNNDYVDGTDVYRHSKWLSMMQKRLKLAKKLLNPEDSVLIITIDEKEYLHLGMLLEDMFSGQRIQMVSSVISRKGSTRHGNFTRKCEYIFFVMFGVAAPSSSFIDMSTGTIGKTKQCWRGLTREGSSGLRSRLPSMFYPIYFSKKDGSYVRCGESPTLETPRESIPVPEECFAVFPAMSIRGEEQGWRLSQAGFNERLQKGFVRFGSWKPGQETRTIQYAFKNVIEAVESGEIVPIGRDENGVYILPSVGVKLAPSDIFNLSSHDASPNGTDLLRKFLVDRAFPYPKSLYAVHDCIKYFVANKKNALIVDFFAGSGTTLHAVNLINAEDGGNRRCICVTNNEVSEKDAKKLISKGIAFGSEEWCEQGIARYITWPRIKCSILGTDIYGKPIEGKYGSEIEIYETSDEEKVNKKYYVKNKMQIYPEMETINISDGFEANVNFFKLEFLDKTSVALGRQLKELIPLLWMKAGAHGICPDTINEKMMIYPENNFAILVDEKCFWEFEKKLEEYPQIQTIYFVTDSDSGYREMISRYQDRDTYQLYKDYLNNFRINTGR